MKKWIKILLVTLGIIAVLVVTTILLLPPIAKNYLEKHSKELVGRQITIEKLRFNVLNGKLRIDQIAWPCSARCRCRHPSPERSGSLFRSFPCVSLR